MAGSDGKHIDRSRLCGACNIMRMTRRRFLAKIFGMHTRGVRGHIAVALMLGSLAGVPARASAVGSDAVVERGSVLVWQAYMTAHAVERLAADPASYPAVRDRFRALRVSRVVLEVYRSGLVVPQAHLESVRDAFIRHGFTVAGGIATVPGGDFGVPANAGLAWFNWQNPKTQRDLEAVMRMSARVFDEFIVDDFLCTGDLSAESDAARGDRSWSEYRRDLLTELSQSVFIDPAREVNPAIRMIIKYPQWYDRFHLFGYDVARKSPLFDQVWVGTETRGANTQRFGYVQPYEGFVNYRWLGSVAGPRLGGAWFDHGDCDAHDFVEQAWQTVLAGAREILLFNSDNLLAGHPGHDLLQQDFDHLDRLAAAVKESPVIGFGAYKPPNSDAGSDLYVMDYLGMLGLPLIPHSTYPHASKTVFLPTQAAADPHIERQAARSLEAGHSLVVTVGFLAALPEHSRFHQWTGLARPVQRQPLLAPRILDSGQAITLDPPLRLAAPIDSGTGRVLLEALVDGARVPFLTEHSAGPGRVSVLNVHTFSQADFDAVGEVLLAPRPLGLLDLPVAWAGQLRKTFGHAAGAQLRAPTRVTLQPLQNRGWFLQNYNSHPVQVTLTLVSDRPRTWVDGFTGAALLPVDGALSRTLPPRSRWWIDTDFRERSHGGAAFSCPMANCGVAYVRPRS